MDFLQPWVLAALPLIALPILIHLINRNRHRSVDWEAMMFLVKANRMNKGMARLRYVLIMLLRMAAVAAIIFAIGRLLLSGKLGGFSMAKPDATHILLDCSASMDAPTFGVAGKPLRIPFSIRSTIGQDRDISITLNVNDKRILTKT